MIMTWHEHAAMNYRRTHSSQCNKLLVKGGLARTSFLCTISLKRRASTPKLSAAPAVNSWPNKSSGSRRQPCTKIVIQSMQPARHGGAWYSTWLLVNLTPKGVVFFSCLSSVPVWYLCSRMTHLKHQNATSKNCYARQDYVKIFCDVGAAVSQLIQDGSSCNHSCSKKQWRTAVYIDHCCGPHRLFPHSCAPSHVELSRCIIVDASNASRLQASELSLHFKHIPDVDSRLQAAVGSGRCFC